MPDYQTIGLLRNPDADVSTVLPVIFGYLAERYTVVLDKSCAHLQTENANVVDTQTLGQADLVVVVGGDGTLLGAGRRLARYKVPMIGINLGRLGFLVDVSPDLVIQNLSAMLDGKHDSDHRWLLAATVVRDGQSINQQVAFNDVIVNNDRQVRMIEFATHIDGQFVNHERADGMIVCTPTGSTAYSLSSGGPILHPALDAIGLVPICPHTLSHRPLVISGNSEITLVIDKQSDTSAQVTFDGQENFKLQPGDEIVIRKAPDQVVTLLHPKRWSFFAILRAKLNWGRSPTSVKR